MIINTTQIKSPEGTAFQRIGCNPIKKKKIFAGFALNKNIKNQLNSRIKYEFS
jgi:hypothetical protein